MKSRGQLEFIALLLILLWTSGCTPAVTGVSPSTSPLPSTPAMMEVLPTQTKMPVSRLQITYIQETSDSVDGIYAVDVTCQANNKLCLGEPKLLFQTFPASDGDLNKPTGSISSYSWSPDGSSIVLSNSKDIFVGDMKTKEWTNITKSPEIKEFRPQWSPDGKYIYYFACSHELGYGVCKPSRFTPTGQNKVDLLNTVDNSIDYFTVSPDNQRIVFSMPKDGFDNLYQSDLTGSGIRPITSTESEEAYPSLSETYPFFSPDGESIAFVRQYYQNPVGISKEITDLIIRDLVSGEEKNLTEKFEGEAFSPAFSLDGKWIAFNTTNNIYVVSTDQGVVFPVTQGNDNTVMPSWRQFYEQK